MTIPAELLSKWRSLGIIFSNSPDTNADPEKTVLLSLPHLRSDSKMLFLISNWMKVHGNLIHCERLLSLTKNLRISYDDLMTLAALVEYGEQNGHKMEVVSRHLKSKKKRGRAIKTAEYMSLPMTLGQCLPEPAFVKYGINVPPIEDLSSKIADIRLITKTNKWIKNRIFFGCNWRADIYTAIQENRSEEKTTYRLAKDLGCSSETALRIRKNFDLVADLKI